MRNTATHSVVVLSLLLFLTTLLTSAAPIGHLLEGTVPQESFLTVQTNGGGRGGDLIVAQRSEIKTLNPLVALDAPSREVIGRMSSDLITVNRRTQRIEPALAESWKASPDGKHYVLRLRPGLRFSDGFAFDSDDVVFSFRLYLDESLHAPQREQLIVGGRPVEVKKLGQYSVSLDFADTFASVERLFDSIPMLPKHLFEKAYTEGKATTIWGLNSKPEEIAGMGPFRLKGYEPGQQITLERNPYYWKTDQNKQQLPYLDHLKFTFAGSEDGQVARFLSGEADIINRLGSNSFSMLQKANQSKTELLDDLGPGFEYTFLAFNFADELFRQTEFRRAISMAIDRNAIARIAYSGRATPILGNVTPANRTWLDERLQAPKYSSQEARKLLLSAGFKWGHDDKLLSRSGMPVQFSIITASNNNERLQAATMIQYDLSRIGIDVQVVPLEFRALVDRVTRSRQFQACILSFGGGDGDPNTELNVWLSSGSMHVWSPEEKHPETAWEAEIDQLMRRQMSVLDQKKRKEMYDRVQEIVAEQQPIICLVSPHILVASRRKVMNFRPAVMESYTLWNADILAVSHPPGAIQ